MTAVDAHMIIFFLLVLIADPQRIYHEVPLRLVAKSQRTHIETCGLVVYRRKMQDGDWHVTLSLGIAKLVVEFIPAIKLDPPARGQWVRVRGIRRYDDGHNWPEIHPVESWEIAADQCKGKP